MPMLSYIPYREIFWPRTPCQECQEIVEFLIKFMFLVTFSSPPSSLRILINTSSRKSNGQGDALSSAHEQATLVTLVSYKCNVASKHGCSKVLISGITARGVRGQSAPNTFHREISDDLPGKEREGKKGKSKTGRWKIENGRRKSYKIRRGLLFSLLKTTEICFGSTKMGIFYWEKKKFHTGKKNQEKWFCPLWKIFLLCPWRWWPMNCDY